MGIINTRMTLSSIEDLFEVKKIYSPLNPMYKGSPSSDYLDWLILSDGELYLAFWHSKFSEEKHTLVDMDSIKIIGGDTGFFGSIYNDLFSAERYARSQSGWKPKDTISMEDMLSIIQDCEYETAIEFEYKPERIKYVDRLSNNVLFISTENNFSLIEAPCKGEKTYFISAGEPHYTSFKVYPQL